MDGWDDSPGFKEEKNIPVEYHLKSIFPDA